MDYVKGNEKGLAMIRISNKLIMGIGVKKC